MRIKLFVPKSRDAHQAHNPGDDVNREPASQVNHEVGAGGPSAWPTRPQEFAELLSPVEAAQYLRLDETGAHTPDSAVRTLNFWRGKGELRATKFARRVWYRRAELDRFLERKTED